MHTTEQLISTDYSLVAEIDNERLRIRGMLARINELEFDVLADSAPMVGDGVRFERDGCRYCTGCSFCWSPEIAEREAWERGL